MGIEYKIIVMGVNGYGFIDRYFIFILVLVIFTLFTYKAPNGMRAMGALANAAIATFLVEAFNKYVGGEVFGIKFLEELRRRCGRSRWCRCRWINSIQLSVCHQYMHQLCSRVRWYGFITRFLCGYMIGYVMKYTRNMCRMVST